MFTFRMTTNVVFGSGVVQSVGELVRPYGGKALMVCTSGKWQADLLENIALLLAKEGIASSVFSGVVPNPTTDSVNAGVRAAKAMAADVIIGVGGGSSMDTAKAIAVGATHPGEAWEYRLWQKEITDKTLPIVAVTTTAGSGAEVTCVAAASKTDEHCKFALADPHLFPKVAVVDPSLTLSLPAHITAATAFDAYCHAFECVLNKNANPYVTAQAEWAMGLVVRNLPLALSEPGNLTAREALSLANTVAGICIANVGVTLPHGIGMAIGGSAPTVSHGEALAIIYPEIARASWSRAIPQYAAAARQLNPGLANVDEADAARSAAGELEKFLRRVGLAIGFADKGVAESVLDAIAEDTFGLPDYQAHPWLATKHDVRQLLGKCYPAPNR